MLRMIVDRCHGADTHRQVIRYIISRLKGGYRGWMAMDRERRRKEDVTEAPRPCYYDLDERTWKREPWSVPAPPLAAEEARCKQCDAPHDRWDLEYCPACSEARVGCMER